MGMELKVTRIWSNDKCTLGYLSIVNKSISKFICATLEDRYNQVKVPGKTRIPAGRYEILLRREGNLVKKYNDRFVGHDGMLHLQNVPGFEWVYIHIGNDDEDTEGCLLIGYQLDFYNNKILDSVNAYKDIYPILARELNAGNQVFITIEDFYGMV